MDRPRLRAGLPVGLASQWGCPQGRRPARPPDRSGNPVSRGAALHAYRGAAVGSAAGPLAGSVTVADFEVAKLGGNGTEARPSAGGQGPEGTVGLSAASSVPLAARPMSGRLFDEGSGLVAVKRRLGEHLEREPVQVGLLFPFQGEVVAQVLGADHVLEPGLAVRVETEDDEGLHEDRVRPVQWEDLQPYVGPFGFPGE